MQDDHKGTTITENKLKDHEYTKNKQQGHKCDKTTIFKCVLVSHYINHKCIGNC